MSEFTGFYSNDPLYYIKNKRPIFVGDTVRVRGDIGVVEKDEIEDDEIEKYLIHWAEYDEEKGIPEYSYLSEYSDEVVLEGATDRFNFKIPRR